MGNVKKLSGWSGEQTHFIAAFYLNLNKFR